MANKKLKQSQEKDDDDMLLLGDSWDDFQSEPQKHYLKKIRVKYWEIDDKHDIKKIIEKTFIYCNISKIEGIFQLKNKEDKTLFLESNSKLVEVHIYY